MKKTYTFFIIILLFNSVVYTQDIGNLNSNFESKQLNIEPIALTVISVFYLFNPIFIYKDNKLYGGITKEFSIGFGYFGEHRAAVDYSYIFAGENRHNIRISYKYDILLKDGVQPSNTLQLIPALSIGGGYFTDFEKQGVFPEISYGFSLRNQSILIYPHVKARYTYVFDKINNPDYTDNFDVSAGITIGIANPFMDLKIRREY